MSSLSLLLFFLITLHATAAAAEVKNTASTKCPSARPPPPRMAATKEEAQLKVLVPNITKVSLRQFVDCSDPSNVRGFCIDVFETALSILVPHNLTLTTIHYTCFNFSPKSPNSTDSLTYDDMLGGVANGSYDVVVGDVTINAQRELEVEFTYPYMESGVVIIAKANDDEMSEWKFFATPFTWRMWCMAIVSFVFTGCILWIIDHKYHPEFTEGSFAKRIYKIFWFIMEALILLQRESVKSATAQLVMVTWVFVVLLLSASYTAGLSSMLTVSNLSPTVYDIVTLKANNSTIGYRKGSFVKDYLLGRFHISKFQLKPIQATVDFVNNITHDDKIAIIDELPYANIILRNLSSCKFDITRPRLTSEGFGFGFKRGLKLIPDSFSIALMNLTESGCLQELQDNHMLSGITKNCSSNSQYKKVSSKSLITLSFPLITLSYLCVIISWVRQSQRQRLLLSANQRPMVTIDDPSILQAQNETTYMSRHRDLELCTLLYS